MQGFAKRGEARCLGHDEAAQRRGYAQSYSNSEGHEASLTLHSVSLHAGAENQAGSSIWPYIHVHLSICGCSVGGVTNRLIKLHIVSAWMLRRNRKFTRYLYLRVAGLPLLLIGLLVDLFTALSPFVLRLQVSSGVLTAVSCDNGVNGDNGDDDEGDDDDDGRPSYLRQILLKEGCERNRLKHQNHSELDPQTSTYSSSMFS